MKTTGALAQPLAEDFFFQHPVEAAHELEKRPSSEIMAMLKSQSPETASRLLTYISAPQAAHWLEQLGLETALPIFEKLDSRDAAQVLAQFEKKDRNEILQKLPLSHREEIQGLLTYKPNQAGFFMDPRVFTFASSDTVHEVLIRIRSNKKHRILNIYVVGEEKILLGVVPLEVLVLAEGNTSLVALMNANPYIISDFAPREEAIDIFDKSRVASLPVVNFARRLLGVIRHSALVEAVEIEALSDLQTMVGAGSEERALSKVFFAVKKRLPWLHINLATAFLAAAVVGLFEDTIARFTALAVLLPVVAGQSGNSGAQALAVTLRGLALREVRVRQWARIAFKETRVGLINGFAVAITTGVGVYFWSRSLGLAMVIGVAMVISMMMAGLSGAIIPIALTALRQDPAQSSSIFLTTVTDIVGFFSFLGLATILAGFL